MRRIVWLVLALALVLPLGACGSGGGHGGGFFGTLEVCNDPGSFEDIDTVSVEDEFGDVFFYDLFLFPGECDFVDDFFPDTYFVTLFWSDGFEEGDFVDIFDDEVTTIEGFR